MDLERFVKRFGFKVARVKHRNPYEYFDSYGMDRRAYYAMSSRDTTIEMEINQRELESMADYFIKTEKMLNEDHEEYRLRRDNPALQEAYSKYKMLLELYR